jgi:phage terminase large subunit-like protein
MRGDADVTIAAIVDAAVELLERPQPQEHQLPPAEPWDLWVTAGGRGSGKSFGGIAWLAQYAYDHPGMRARIIAPTFGDAVASCVEGPSGLKRLAPRGTWKPSEPGGAMYDFGNGSKVWLIGTPTPNDVDRLRALGNIHVDFFEEFAANRQAAAAWEQAKLSRRNPTIPNKAGRDP